MLVLKRKLGEVITVGDPLSGHPPIEIVALAIRGELVDLAVSAPAGIAITPKSPAPSRRQKQIAAANAEKC